MQYNGPCSSKMAVLGRGVSMFSLITDGILEPGHDNLTFDYLGKRYSGDLLPEGTIQSGGRIFASPYAWASHCKNLINPDQKTAIGWGHIRYKGIKLSQYKSIYMKKHKLSFDQELSDFAFDTSPSVQMSAPLPNAPVTTNSSKKVKKKKLTAGTDQAPPSTNDATTSSTASLVTDSSNSDVMLPGNTVQGSAENRQAALSLTSELVECSTWGSSNETQPFDITISSNVLLTMDFHSHLCWSEVAGYIGGKYSEATKVLQVVRVFPCQCTTTDEAECEDVDKKIKRQLIESGLSLVGWYHSHPSNDALPSINDVTQHLMYQEALISDKGDTPPCIGFIISPNLASRRNDIQSNISCYTVKRKDSLHALPLTLTYKITWEKFLTQDVADEMSKLTTYYRFRQDAINFMAPWREGIPFVHKLKTSMANFQPKFEQTKSDDSFFTFIDQLVLK